MNLGYCTLQSVDLFWVGIHHHFQHFLVKTLLQFWILQAD
ncbi:hypothetical protein SLEP1_g18343 [Rubroshorea leprosula]|uniref:Uncharacterized protein n=1 Tax=Rubroshorea leprosula TaxID=152421 RepID=A0AAV5J0Q1_9ROSI|nr:hypothetical protein SLEP1_g18343 [Rubroshorea leprosula]